VKGRKNSSREDILRAAESGAVKSGAANLTLDSVAREAGVSKGGLLYHFPSKEALLQGMIARMIEQFDEDRRATESRMKGPGSLLRAYVDAATDDDGPTVQVQSAILAAAANNPALLAPAREYHQKLFKELAAQCENFETALTVVLATKGLWLLEILDVSPLTRAQRRKLVQELFRLAEAAG